MSYAIAIALFVQTGVFALGVALWFLFRKVGQWIALVKELNLAVARATSLLSDVSAITGALRETSAALHRHQLAAERQTVVIENFTAAFFRQEAGGEFQPPPPAGSRGWVPGGPPLPPNPAYEQFAAGKDAGFVSQDDEQLAEMERQEQLREQGIETDPLRIPMPSPDQIKIIQS